MTHNIDIDRAQGILKHTFREPSRLSKALQAPEKIHDRETKNVVHQDDGNRPLAQLGHKVIEMVLIDQWFNAGSDRGMYATNEKLWSMLISGSDKTQAITNKLAGNEFLAQVARRTGLDNCVRYSERQISITESPPQTLKLVTTAVVGAVWLDSDRDFHHIVHILEHLG